MTEDIIARALRQGVADGVFAISDVSLTAALIKPLLQDWYVKRAKYRKRGTSIDTYIGAVTNLIIAAISTKGLMHSRQPPGSVARKVS
jgi:hypothetical protein